MTDTVIPTIAHVSGPVEETRYDEGIEFTRRDIRCLRCDEKLWTSFDSDEEPWPVGMCVLQISDETGVTGFCSDGPASGRDRRAAEVPCQPR